MEIMGYVNDRRKRMERTLEKMEMGKFYTWRELRKMICPTQSTTADYIIMDLIASGRLQEGVKRTFRKNI